MRRDLDSGAPVDTAGSVAPMTEVIPGRPASARTPTRRHVLRPRGSLTAASAGRLLDRLRSVCPAPALVEIDLSRVTSVDRAGAVGVLDAYVATLLRRGAFALSHPSPACRRSLKHFGVLDVVDLIGPAPVDVSAS